DAGLHPDRPLDVPLHEGQAGARDRRRGRPADLQPLRRDPGPRREALRRRACVRALDHRAGGAGGHFGLRRRAIRPPSLHPERASSDALTDRPRPALTRPGTRSTLAAQDFETDRSARRRTWSTGPTGMIAPGEAYFPCAAPCRPRSRTRRASGPCPPHAGPADARPSEPNSPRGSMRALLPRPMKGARRTTVAGTGLPAAGTAAPGRERARLLVLAGFAIYLLFGIAWVGLSVPFHQHAIDDPAS